MPQASAVTGRVFKALLFGDLTGFSRLGEAQIRSFVEQVKAPLAARLQSLPTQPDLLATWGDGLHAVYPSAATAAEAALALQAAFAEIPLADVGLPADMALRIGAHYGPVTPLDDPYLKTASYYGTHITVAARIEPVTVPGAVFVTEPFAAELALTSSAFAAEYVGQTELAKGFGTVRLFALRREGAGR